LDNVDPYIGDRTFSAINQDMRVALPELDMRVALPELSGTFGFVFYDADHTAAAVADFWALTPSLLAESCTLVFDDADWAEQSTLRGLAEADGFQVVTDTPFYRGGGDKDNPATYTLEVMRRG
jgi:hypothetical protein